MVMVVVQNLGFRRFLGGGGGGGGTLQEGFSALRGAGLFLAELGGIREGSLGGSVGRLGRGFCSKEVGIGGEGTVAGYSWRCRGVAMSEV